MLMYGRDQQYCKAVILHLKILRKVNNKKKNIKVPCLYPESYTEENHLNTEY